MIYIANTAHFFTPDKAKQFMREHVVISKKALHQISKLARKHKIYDELKKLNIEIRELGPEPDDE